MLFNFEDINLQTLEKKIRAEERLSFDDGVILWNSFDLLGVGYYQKKPILFGGRITSGQGPALGARI